MTQFGETNTAEQTWTSFCGGTLISESTILTAAHCVVKSVPFTYQNVLYNLKVEPNEFFSTFESMYTVYVGLHDKKQIDSAQKLAVKKISLVNKIQY